MFSSVTLLIIRIAGFRFGCDRKSGLAHSAISRAISSVTP
jgi:hypothetical protein